MSIRQHPAPWPDYGNFIFKCNLWFRGEESDFYLFDSGAASAVASVLQCTAMLATNEPLPPPHESVPVPDLGSERVQNG